MKKLIPDSKVTIREGLPAAKWRSLNKQYCLNKQYLKKRKSFEPGLDFGIEYFKGKPTKFWDGVLLGLILGYIPYLWHMHL
jgi:hypothetical protein